MRHFKLKAFQRWFKKAKLNDQKLHSALADLVDNKSCVELGENLYKVRVASVNKGKSGGNRTIVAYKDDVRSVFLVGFAKNEKDNITKTELKDLKDLAKVLISYDEDNIDIAVVSGALVEIEEETDG